MKRRRKRKSRELKLFILAVRNSKEEVTDLKTSYDYSSLMIEGMELGKERQGTWSIYRLHRPGVEIDGGTLSIKEFKNGR